MDKIAHASENRTYEESVILHHGKKKKAAKHFLN